MVKKCIVDGCGCDSLSQGGRWNKRPNAETTKYCRKHYRRTQKYGSPDVKKSSKAPMSERFWLNVEIRGDDDCWLWKASSKSKNGYGSIWDNSTKSSRLAHRVSYELANGYVPDEFVVMHACDNPQCVNPKHLRLGTHRLNTFDMIQKGRKKVARQFGEENPKSKMTLEQAKFIKAHPEMGHKQIADMWGLSPNCIRSVRIGRTWKDA